MISAEVIGAVIADVMRPIVKLDGVDVEHPHKWNIEEGWVIALVPTQEEVEGITEADSSTPIRIIDGIVYRTKKFYGKVEVIRTHSNPDEVHLSSKDVKRVFVDGVQVWPSIDNIVNVNVPTDDLRETARRLGIKLFESAMVEPGPMLKDLPPAELPDKETRRDTIPPMHLHEGRSCLKVWSVALFDHCGEELHRKVIGDAHRPLILFEGDKLKVTQNIEVSKKQEFAVDGHGDANELALRPELRASKVQMRRCFEPGCANTVKFPEQYCIWHSLEKNG